MYVSLSGCAAADCGRGGGACMYVCGCAASGVREQGQGTPASNNCVIHNRVEGIGGGPVGQWAER